MSNNTTKTTNPSYDILDRILRESDRSQFGPNGRPLNPNGVELTPEQLATISQGVDDIEKYIRS